MANVGRATLDRSAADEIGWLCYAKDPDGNIFGMMQRRGGS